MLWPLSRAPATTDARELDVAFYKAQSAEIERDLARGVIGSAEADVARTEAGRRLVSASRREADDVARSSPWATRLVALGAVVFIPVVSLAVYEFVGSPMLPDDPLEARLRADPAKMDAAAMFAKVEANVARNPNDGRGWSILARLYARQGRTEPAIAAFRNEIRLLGPSEDRLARLGEAEMMAAEGKVTDEARHDFEQALALAPKSPRARYYLGLAAEQGGDPGKALALYRQVVADAPADAPYVPALDARIAALSEAPALPAGVPAQAAAAVASLPAPQQQAMIRRMVDGLADRLKANGNDIDGWLRLMRAYRVLDEPDKAKGALTEARRSFAGDPAAKLRLDSLARELGIEG